MKVINLAETNSILNQFVAEMRDVNVQNDRMRFRRNIERIGELMAYEISKTLDYSTKKIQTPLGIAEASTPDDNVVIATVFRAGLPLHAGFLNIFDKAGNAFVSAYRYYKDKDHRDLDVRIEYIATPDLTNKTVILVDPMLATGGSLCAALHALRSRGVKDIVAMVIVAAPEGVKAVLDTDPDVRLFTCALDEGLNENAYIVPGLGDAGDRIFQTTGTPVTSEGPKA